MLRDMIFLLGSSLALFLVGANASFLINLWQNLAAWFIFKIVAVDLVFIYLAAAMFTDGTNVWLAALGCTAMIIDIAALGFMWITIERLRKSGRTGFIPIARNR